MSSVIYAYARPLSTRTATQRSPTSSSRPQHCVRAAARHLAKPLYSSTLQIIYQPPHRLGRRLVCRASSEPEPSVSTPATETTDQPVNLKAELKKLDLEFEKLTSDEAASLSSEASALHLVTDLKERGAIAGYGSWRGVPKRAYTLAEMRLNKVDAEKLLSPEDTKIDAVQNLSLFAAALGTAAGVYLFHPSFADWVRFGGGVLGLKALDQVGNGGGGEALVLDALARVVYPDYAARVAQHEAAHFLTAYLLALLPKGYTLSSWDALRQYNSMNVQAGCLFCDTAFQKEVGSGRVGSASVDRFSCVAMAGVAMEYLAYGQSEGGMADIRQLDAFMNALGFTQKKAESQVRWAVLNTVALLREHRATHEALVKAMRSGASVGECIYTIETNLPPATP